MKCAQVVPFTIWDIAAGLDRSNQGRGNVVKDCYGRLWEPTKLTPMEAAMCGLKIGYLRDGKICDR